MMKKIISILLACMMLGCIGMASASPLAGGWFVPESTEVTEESRAIFDKAMEGFVGVNYEPLQVLGTQVVAGLNYCFLCRAAVVVPDAEDYLALVYVYADLEGGATITDIQPLEVGIRYEEEAVEDGQNPVMEIIGDYQDQNGRASMNISAVGEGGSTGALVVIDWADSASEGCRWTLSGELNPETMVISYQEGTVEKWTADENGEVVYTPVNLVVGGEFIVNEDGTVLWNDAIENQGEGCCFVPSWLAD